MNDYERMRAWLVTQDGPRGSRHFVAALGIKRQAVAHAISDMYRSGALIRQPTTPYTYLIGSQVKPKRLTPEQRAENYRLHSIKFRRGKGCVPRAEYEAACKAKRDAERAAIDARKAERKARGDTRRAAKAERKANPKPRVHRPAVVRVYVPKPRKPKPIAFKPVAVPRMRLVASKPAPVAVPLMSSAEFIAAGGVIEVLPAFWNLEIAA